MQEELKENNIQCPKCGVAINVQEIVYHQINKKFQNQIQQKQEEYKKAFDDLERREKSIQESITKGAQELLEKKEQELKERLKEAVRGDYAKMIEDMQKELDEKSQQTKELYATQAEIQKLRREKEEAESKIEARAQASLAQQMQDYKQKLEAQILLQIKEKDKKIQDMQKQLTEAQRTAQSGSQQLQGEVQELAIEEYLQSHFPFDTIEEIRKGQSGGDCIQIIHTRDAQNCGKIYYESKRTKEFKREWIEKFKGDMRQRGVDVGVLITESMPKELEQMGLLDGIWVCTFTEFKALSFILREGIIQIYLAKKSQENKQDKMQLLYSFLTSVEFKMQIEAIVEGFTQMQIDLEREKMAVQKLWKQREKQIQKVLEGATGLYGSIKGIAGSAIENIKFLELADITERKDF